MSLARARPGVRRPWEVPGCIYRSLRRRRSCPRGGVGRPPTLCTILLACPRVLLPCHPLPFLVALIPCTGGYRTSMGKRSTPGGVP